MDGRRDLVLHRPDRTQGAQPREEPALHVLTGCNLMSKALDLVVEGDAVPVRDRATLESAAAAFNAKYQAPFRFTVDDFAFAGEGGQALVFEVRPTRAFGYGRGEQFTATRWRFSAG